jgi:DNA-binding NarL/FixJ family response regulator
MSKAQVVILSGQTLFAEGIASRLQQFPQKVAVSILNPEGMQTLERISQAQPAAVIIEASEPRDDTLCSLCTLLTTIPGLKVIRLDPEHSDVQIITSTHLRAADVRDLVELLD